jgi:VIT1/CCC1 family predicted Fe2+/Mn2+ transporter
MLREDDAADDTLPAAAPLERTGWLRAAVLGANDGIVSTASLLVGVAAADASPLGVVTAGIAGLVAGAASMAAGEYVSVSSQRDLEEVLIRKQQEKVTSLPEVALTELAIALQLRGLSPGLARRVAEQVSAVDPVGARMRVLLGLSEHARARPLQAAGASATAFATGGLIPLCGLMVGAEWRMAAVVGLALVALGTSGALAAEAGGASRTRAALRVLLGGGFAMALSAGVGRLLGVAL